MSTSSGVSTLPVMVSNATRTQHEREQGSQLDAVPVAGGTRAAVGVVRTLHIGGEQRLGEQRLSLTGTA